MKKNRNLSERSLQRSEFCIFLHAFSGFSSMNALHWPSGSCRINFHLQGGGLSRSGGYDD